MKNKSKLYQIIGLILLSLGTLGLAMNIGYGWRINNDKPVYGIIPMVLLLLSGHFSLKAKKAIATEDETEKKLAFKNRLAQLFLVMQCAYFGYVIGYKLGHDNYTIPSNLSSFFCISTLFMAIMISKKSKKKETS